MRCLSCQYDLRNLRAGAGEAEAGHHRCPECGRVFDPGDKRTFATGRTHLRWLASLGVIIMLATPIWLPPLVVFIKRLL